MNIPEQRVQHGHSMFIGSEQSADNTWMFLHFTKGIVPVTLLFSTVKLTKVRC